MTPKYAIAVECAEAIEKITMEYFAYATATGDYGKIVTWPKDKAAAIITEKLKGLVEAGEVLAKDGEDMLERLDKHYPEFNEYRGGRPWMKADMRKDVEALRAELRKAVGL